MAKGKETTKAKCTVAEYYNAGMESFALVIESLKQRNKLDDEDKKVMIDGAEGAYDILFKSLLLGEDKASTSLALLCGENLVEGRSDARFLFISIGAKLGNNFAEGEMASDYKDGHDSLYKKLEPEVEKWVKVIREHNVANKENTNLVDKMGHSAFADLSKSLSSDNRQVDYVFDHMRHDIPLVGDNVDNHGTDNCSCCIIQ